MLPGPGGKMMKTIRITAKRDGFRRCGLSHPAMATNHPADRFDEEQLAALKKEPMLVVEEIESGDGVIAETGPVGTMKVEELKALLDKLSVAYPGDARKADLVALVENHTGEPSEE
jgi:Mu-like prophage FluMu N-terminal domain/HeH/LEM domain